MLMLVIIVAEILQMRIVGVGMRLWGMAGCVLVSRSSRVASCMRALYTLRCCRCCCCSCVCPGGRSGAVVVLMLLLMVLVTTAAAAAVSMVLVGAARAVRGVSDVSGYRRRTVHATISTMHDVISM